MTMLPDAASPQLDWFGTPYYEKLYRHRDEREACQFIANLIKYVPLRRGDRALDIGCGRGRHALCLNENGLDVDAFDISPQCIDVAKALESPTLRFHVHDMREPFSRGGFRCAMNMFTSFGYFDDPAENERAVCAAAQSLSPGGTFVLDFMNTHWIVPRLNPFSVQVVDDIRFYIHRRLENGFIVKTIDFSDAGREFHFTERVRDIRLPEIKGYFARAGLTIRVIFGDYDLSEYQENASRRIIVIGDAPAADDAS
jgi:SAM-dependent methyltransferase